MEIQSREWVAGEQIRELPVHLAILIIKGGLVKIN
jgi:hypothetical protein